MISYNVIYNFSVESVFFFVVELRIIIKIELFIQKNSDIVVFVVAVPQRVCPSKPAPLKKSKQLDGECHRSSGLLMLCCVLKCVSAGQWVIMYVRPWVPVLQCVQTSSTESSILFR